MRLIDADKVLKEIAQRQKAYANPINEYEAACGDGIQTARYEIEEAPTIDAVPVIRCKDCKHWQYDSCFVDSAEGDAESIILDRFAFDFCSRAERKEE